LATERQVVIIIIIIIIIIDTFIKRHKCLGYRGAELAQHSTRVLLGSSAATCALILFKISSLYKSFTYLLTYLLTYRSMAPIF